MTVLHMRMPPIIDAGDKKSLTLASPPAPSCTGDDKFEDIDSGRGDRRGLRAGIRNQTVPGI